jgi:cytochrome c553
MIAAIGTIGLRAEAPADWSWAFPPGVPAMPDKPDTVKQYSIAGSTRHFTEAESHDLTHAVDWFPAEHPPMPGLAATGHGGANACSFCHLPSGGGRPENSALAGLPADYIERQVAAFADGSRKAAIPNAGAGRMMTITAKAAVPAEVAEAAAYYSKLPFTSYVSVVEVGELPKPAPFRFVYVLGTGPKEPLGDRIVEVPADADRFELRDPHLRFTAYVPVGSLAQGKALAASGGPVGQACEICHGVGLQGDVAPALAGRSPTMIVRQLMAFKAGTRANAEAAPMREIAAGLKDRDMIALAAYAATLKP